MFIFAELMAKVILGDITGGNTIADVAFVIRCISFAILIIPYLSVTKGYIQGHKIITPTSIGSVIEQAVRIFVILAGSFLAYKVFTSTLSFAVGISVTGAFFGGLIAYIYLRRKMNSNKEQLGIKTFEKKDSITDKEILKKIAAFAIPYIILNIATSIYNFTDMVLVLRGLDILGYSAADAEFIQSAITTWSTKVCMIINAFSMGMVVSLIPNIVSSFVKGDWTGVGNKINKAYQIVLVISIPCAVGILLLAEPIWSIFYGSSVYGPIVLELMVVGAIFGNLYSITFNTMQSLNKFKVVYFSVILGFAFNAILDIPLILLYDKIGLPPYWGAISATIIGYATSVKIATHNLKKNHNLHFGPTYKMVLKILIPTLVMAIEVLMINHFIPFGTSTISLIIKIAVNVVIGGITYIVIAYKMRILEDIFGKAMLNKIIKKLTFNKVSLN